MADHITFEALQTLVRKAFDPQTISVTVGKIGEIERRFKVEVQDVISRVSYIFHVNYDHALEDIHAMMQRAADTLSLVEGPDRTPGAEAANAS